MRNRNPFFPFSGFSMLFLPTAGHCSMSWPLLLSLPPGLSWETSLWTRTSHRFCLTVRMKQPGILPCSRRRRLPTRSSSVSKRGSQRANNHSSIQQTDCHRPWLSRILLALFPVRQSLPLRLFPNGSWMPCQTHLPPKTNRQWREYLLRKLSGTVSKKPTRNSPRRKAWCLNPLCRSTLLIWKVLFLESFRMST